MGVEIKELRNMSKEKIKLRVNGWEQGRWREELSRRETLQVNSNKSRIQEENIYSNNFGSVLLFRCRTNTLKRIGEGDIRVERCSVHQQIVVCSVRKAGRGDCAIFESDAACGLRHVRTIHGVREEPVEDELGRFCCLATSLR